jgi:hypothetical protein
MTDEDQDLVAGILASMPPPDVPADFLARVNARIDETAGWIGLADFRLWTLRLVPAAAVLALIAIVWPVGPASTARSPASPSVTTTQAARFSPSSAGDWQKDVTADALLDAALHFSPGDARVR